MVPSPAPGMSCRAPRSSRKPSGCFVPPHGRSWTLRRLPWCRMPCAKSSCGCSWGSGAPRRSFPLISWEHSSWLLPTANRQSARRGFGRWLRSRAWRRPPPILTSGIEWPKPAVPERDSCSSCKSPPTEPRCSGSPGAVWAASENRCGSPESGLRGQRQRSWSCWTWPKRWRQSRICRILRDRTSRFGLSGQFMVVAASLDRAAKHELAWIRLQRTVV